MSAWRLIIREPRAGEMHGVLDHQFPDLPSAIRQVESTCRFADQARFGLATFENGREGAFFCAWPYFGDLEPAECLDGWAVCEEMRAAGINI